MIVAFKIRQVDWISVMIAALIGCASDKKPAWVRFAEKQPNKWGH